VQPSECGDTVAKQDVHTTARHVGRNGHGAALTRPGDDRGLLRFVTCVQHVVGKCAQSPAQLLGLLNTRSADQHRLPCGMHPHNLLNHGVVFFTSCAEHLVRMTDADKRAVGGNGEHGQTVDVAELAGLGHRGAGHAADVRIQRDEAFDRHRPDDTALRPHGHTLLALKRSLQSGRPTPVRHDASFDLVNGEDDPVLHDVVHVLCQEHMRVKSFLHRRIRRGVLRVKEAVDAHPQFDPPRTHLCERHTCAGVLDGEVVAMLQMPHGAVCSERQG
jgi:hypothetical protein